MRETRLAVGEVEVVEIVGRLDGDWSGARSEGGRDEDELRAGDAVLLVPGWDPIGLAGRPNVEDAGVGW